MADRTETILNDVENQIRDIAQSAAAQSAPNGHPKLADLEAITNGKDVASAEAVWEDPDELAIMTLVHRAWAMEVERKGWGVSEIASIHVKSLRMAEAALRLIPRREPIA